MPVSVDEELGTEQRSTWTADVADAASSWRTTDDPGATYRVQLGREFGFAQLEEHLGYFAALGITHLYLSPIMQARDGSDHGYDVVDPTAVSTVLGGEDALRALAAAAAQRHVQLIADLVPNHMATAEGNRWWEQLLREGVTGPAGTLFDVDWRPRLPTAEGKVILPVLADPYGTVLAAGGLQLVRRDGSYRLASGDQTFPLREQTLERIGSAGGAKAFTGVPGSLDSWAPLHDLLEAQHYRLVHWRIGDHVINYRRFFTIDDLAAVRMEVPEVFDRLHTTIVDLVADGVISGLRIDHPDGLRDPERYLQQLRNRTGVWTVAEKIVHPGEHLPSSWPVAGTTGYDFCVDVLGLAIDPDGLVELAAIDEQLGGGRPYAHHAVEGKRAVLRTGLCSDLERVAHLLWTVTQQRPEVRDVTLGWCRRVLAATLEHFDVYRTYLDPETGDAREVDRQRVASAIAAARAAESEPPVQLWDFVEALLSGTASAAPSALEVAARFQQLCSAVTAKGTEDSAFYRYRPLLAANEVGADPGQPVRTVAQFQDANVWRAERQPTSLLSTATHDTKRGEDTRLRMAAISEIADLWRPAVDACEQRAQRSSLPAQSRQLVYQTVVGIWPLDGKPHDGHRDRLSAYVVKAEREAGLFTTWTDPDETFERRLSAFARSVLHADDAPKPLQTAISQAQQIAMVTGLAQVVLRCCSPGVPDCYQGTELWDDALVDPDNRRPVSFDMRSQQLRDLEGADAGELYADRRDGRIKSLVLQRCLAVRRRHDACVAAGSGYLPLRVSGRWSEHVVAFARVAPDGSDTVLVVTPRLPGAVMGDAAGPLGDAWQDTTVRVPSFVQADYQDVFAGGGGGIGDEIAVGELLTTLPVAVLEQT